MAIGPALAHVKDLRLSLGGAPLFDGVEFTLHKGERACLVGANGAGKSTLMRMLAGAARAGQRRDRVRLRRRRSRSRRKIPTSKALQRCEIMCARHRLSAPAASGKRPLMPPRRNLHAYGLDPDRAPEAFLAAKPAAPRLARAFAADPDILLLDEPTNHLDISAIEDLEQRIAAFSGACLIISHDRRFLERASTATLWLRQRRMLKSPRGFAAFEEWAEQVETEEARASARLETHLKAEEHWLRRGVTARRSRNEGRRRKLEAMRAERRQQQALSASPKASLQAARGAESAKLVIEAKNISKRYGDRVVIENLSLRVQRGDRIGVVGAEWRGQDHALGNPAASALSRTPAPCASARSLRSPMSIRRARSSIPRSPCGMR